MIRTSIAFLAAAFAASTIVAAEPAKAPSVISLEHPQAPAAHSEIHRFTCQRAGTSVVEMQIDTSHKGDGQDRWRFASLRVDDEGIPAAELAKVDATVGSRALDMVFPQCEPGGGATVRVRMWTKPAPGDEGDGSFEWLLLKIDKGGALTFQVTD